MVLTRFTSPFRQNFLDQPGSLKNVTLWDISN